MDSAFILEWFRLADMDLALADHALSLHPQPLEAICYHCQQSAEKYLKGYLVYKGIVDPPRIHNLDSLCEMCEDFDAQFSKIMKPCSTLTDYGVQPRYPHEMEILESDMRKALTHAKQIQEFEPLLAARQQLKNEMQCENTSILTD